MVTTPDDAGMGLKELLTGIGVVAIAGGAILYAGFKFTARLLGGALNGKPLPVELGPKSIEKLEAIKKQDEQVLALLTHAKADIDAIREEQDRVRLRHEIEDEVNRARADERKIVLQEIERGQIQGRVARGMPTVPPKQD